MTEQFSIKGKTYELFFAQDGHIEIYELDDPASGFIFEDDKRFILFINLITDILEKKSLEEKKWEN